MLELIKNAAVGYEPEKKKKKDNIRKSENEKVMSLIKELKEIALNYNQAAIRKLNFSIPRCNDVAFVHLGISKSGICAYINFYEFTLKFPLVLLIASTSRTFIMKKITKITETKCSWTIFNRGGKPNI